MASFSAPPGHPGHICVLLASRLSDYALSSSQAAADKKEPVLRLSNGECIETTPAIVRFVLHSGESSRHYPADRAHLQAAVDAWIDWARFFEVPALAWLAPSATAGASAEQRTEAKNAITKSLSQLESVLLHATYLVGEALTMADAAVMAVVLPLLRDVVGSDDRARYPCVCRWLATCAAAPAFAPVAGKLSWCSNASGWTVASPQPAATAAAKQPPAATAGSAAAAVDAAVDPEKKAAKEAKAKAKEAKKLKALEKEKKRKEEAQAKQEDKGDKSKDKNKKKSDADARKKAEAEELQAYLSCVKATPKGAKKDTVIDMPKSYNPVAVEAAWYDWWEKCGFFKPEMNSKKEPFVIVIPPPNVTGALHIGHALTNAIQDTIVRWRRMSGYNALWVPGTDHAGIATQTVVEKKLARERGVSRHDLGREKFLEEVYQWVEQYGGKICNQLRRMGSSVDWERQVFTMDANLSKAVLEAFLRMYKKGLIYRENRLVNWCCTLKTAVSDIEVDYVDINGRELINVPGYAKPVEFGVLIEFAYPLEDGSGQIVVATTRIETMLGDTAVAVHPDDDRYKHLHGKFVVHPVNGRKIPIITDGELVDMSFGTGAVKITPAHDPNDFLTGKRHNLEFITIFDDRGYINDNGAQFAGQPRFEARRTVTEFLKEKGLYVGKKDNPMRLGLCSRSKDVIEPALKPQWWVSCGGMAARACDAVRNGDLEIVPKDFEAVWFRWLENIRDWCISRQLWWGHRIPAYYVVFEGESDVESGRPGSPSEKMDRWVVGATAEEAMAAAQKRYGDKKVKLVQDEDVLDTWFSSGLFPFSVMGWPDNTPDLQQFYPGSLLETGHDILFFWVARMVMMGLTLTDKVPFKQVFLHAMVRDAHGRKMSKSLGNVIDPIHVIEGISLEGLHATLLGGNLVAEEVEKAKDGQRKDFPDGIKECGTDALRFALVDYTTQAKDINLDILRVVSYRHWCNKLWNAVRFAMVTGKLAADFTPADKLDVKQLPKACRWILSRLNNAIASTVAAMHAYQFNAATRAVNRYWQNEVCDVFIELMKPVMARDDAASAAAKQGTQQTLWLCLDNGLRLLHPFMPFVTEELWQRLPKRAAQQQCDSIMIAPYPTVCDEWSDDAVEEEMAYVNTICNKVRSLRTDYNLLSKDRPELSIRCTTAAAADIVRDYNSEICTLAGTDVAHLIGPSEAATPQGCGVAVVDEQVTVFLHLTNLKGWDAKLEAEKLSKKQADVAKALASLEKQMSTSGYQEKTRDEVKAEDDAKAARLRDELAAIAHTLEEVKKMF